jgi:glutamate-1-semialdehyde 2,1-aminomutase
MDRIAPNGDVYQAGTLSGNPLAVSAGLAQLRSLQLLNPYAILEENTKKLAEGIEQIAKKAKVPCTVTHTTGLLCVFFTKGEVKDFASAQKSDCEKFSTFWKTLLKNGIYWPPAQFEAAFVSCIHSPAEIEQTLSAMEKAFAAV